MFLTEARSRDSKIRQIICCHDDELHRLEVFELWKGQRKSTIIVEFKNQTLVDPFKQSYCFAEVETGWVKGGRGTIKS